ncbi:hypothetical protein MGAST_28330 [Mycobacterium gastri 'Wayne']|nr:hypothetical protein MGAST_28330 [Mycobacterium gastri 'Wayne']
MRLQCLQCIGRSLSHHIEQGRDTLCVAAELGNNR